MFARRGYLFGIPVFPQEWAERADWKAQSLEVVADAPDHFALGFDDGLLRPARLGHRVGWNGEALSGAKAVLH